MVVREDNEWLTVAEGGHDLGHMRATRSAVVVKYVLGHIVCVVEVDKEIVIA